MIMKTWQLFCSL